MLVSFPVQTSVAPDIVAEYRTGGRRAGSIPHGLRVAGVTQHRPRAREGMRGGWLKELAVQLTDIRCVSN